MIGFRLGGFQVPKDLTRADYRASWAKMVTLLGKMHKAGVPIVAGTDGAAFSAELKLTAPATIVSKATTPDLECYSDFGTTNFEADLRVSGVSRLFIGGLATDYCVLSTVKDALALGFNTFLLVDAIRGVNVHPDDSQNAEQEMIRLGAKPIRLQDLAL